MSSGDGATLFPVLYFPALTTAAGTWQKQTEEGRSARWEPAQTQEGTPDLPLFIEQTQHKARHCSKHFTNIDLFSLHNHVIRVVTTIHYFTDQDQGDKKSSVNVSTVLSVTRYKASSRGGGGQWSDSG